MSCANETGTPRHTRTVLCLRAITAILHCTPLAAAILCRVAHDQSCAHRLPLLTRLPSVSLPAQERGSRGRITPQLYLVPQGSCSQALDSEREGEKK